MEGFYVNGPAVGVGDGTLLIGWPCRLADVEAAVDRPYDMVPLTARWREQGLQLGVMRLDGTMRHYDVEMLQFDIHWKRP